MTKSYAQIKSAIAKLEKEAAALREAETTKVVAQIKESIATFGLTVEHLFGRGAKALKAAVSGGKAARKGAGIPKYRHPKTGKTWTGFGKAPGWIATVRNRDKFLIDQSGVVPTPAVENAVAPVDAVAKKTTRKARTGPLKTTTRARKAASASAATPETKAGKPVARKAAPMNRAPSKKAAPAKKSAAASKVATAKSTKSQAAAKFRRPRASSTAATPVLTTATAETAASQG